MPRLAASVLALALLVALPACDAGASATGLTGTWEGEVVVGTTASYDVTLWLTDTGQSVSGTGTVGSTGGDLAFAVSGGSFVGTVVSLPLYFAADPIPGALVTTDPGRIAGTFSGPADLVGDVQVELVAR